MKLVLSLDELDTTTAILLGTLALAGVLALWLASCQHEPPPVTTTAPARTFRLSPARAAPSDRGHLHGRPPLAPLNISQPWPRVAASEARRALPSDWPPALSELGQEQIDFGPLDLAQHEPLHFDELSPPPRTPDSEGFRPPRARGDSHKARPLLAASLKELAAASDSQLGMRSRKRHRSRVSLGGSPGRRGWSPARSRSVPRSVASSTAGSHYYVPAFVPPKRRKAEKFPQAKLRVCPTALSELPSAFEQPPSDCESEIGQDPGYFSHPAVNSTRQKRPLRSACGSHVSKKKKRRRGNRKTNQPIKTAHDPSRSRLLRYRKRRERSVVVSASGLLGSASKLPAIKKPRRLVKGRSARLPAQPDFGLSTRSL